LEQSLLRNLAVTSLLIILPSGLILAWTVWLTREITARNIKLREREERLRNIVENASETIYTISPEGVITYISPTWNDRLGRDASAVQGKHFETFVHPDDVTGYWTAFREVLATGKPQRGIDYRIRHADGGWRWRSSALSVVQDQRGKPLYLIGIAEDITESKLAQQRQLRSLRRLEGVNRLQEELILPGPIEEKFKKITEAAVSLFDLDFCRIWSVLPGDLCDCDCIHATTTDEAHVCRRRDRCLHLVASSGRYTHTDGGHRRVPLGCYKIGQIATGEEKKRVSNNVTTDPRVHDHEWAKGLGLVSFAGYKLHDARGNTTGLLAMFAKHPISEEDDAFLSHLAETTSKVIMDHHAEEELRQSQKLEGVGQLAGGVAHEFNNLLQVIDGYTCSGMEGLAPEEERYSDLDQVRKAAERATALTRQLLGFSRRRAIEPKSIDANLVVRDLVKLIRPAIGEHISLDLALGDDVGTVYADTGELQQALLNLCVNARDAMPSGGALMLKTEKALVTEPLWDAHFDIKPGRYVVFSVSDTGCGIPRDIQQRIFEPFFTTKEVGKGTGLGLALVYGVMRQHKGAIHVYSEVGMGTTFKLYLPPGGGKAEEDRGEEPIADLFGKETILVAEDEPTVRNLSVRTLERAGYTVLAAADGEEALRMFEENRSVISLVVLDAIMPKLTGHEVHLRIKQVSPEIRFVCCTGYDREIARADCLVHENVPLIQKPFTARTLLSTVREALDAKTPCQPNILTTS
jgi:PAS domain S-box-containing protein